MTTIIPRAAIENHFGWCDISAGHVGSDFSAETALEMHDPNGLRACILLERSG